MNSETICLQPIPWETRNLGIESFAVSNDFLQQFDENSLKAEILQAQSSSAIFVQARISKDQIEIGSRLSATRFYLVESTVCPQIVLKKSDTLIKFIKSKREYIPRRYDFSSLKLESITAENEQVESIKFIAADSFVDDRFHIDPYCPQEIADRRFVYWIDDLLQLKDIRLYILKYENDPIGFFIRQKNNLILAGFKKQHSNSGLGEFLWLSVLEDTLNEGIESARTLISVNNTAVLNLYSRLGFKFKEPLYTFHYWSSLVI